MIISNNTYLICFVLWFYLKHSQYNHYFRLNSQIGRISQFYHYQSNNDGCQFCFKHDELYAESTLQKYILFHIFLTRNNTPNVIKNK